MNSKSYRLSSVWVGRFLCLTIAGLLGACAAPAANKTETRMILAIDGKCYIEKRKTVLKVLKLDPNTIEVPETIMERVPVGCL